MMRRIKQAIKPRLVSAACHHLGLVPRASERLVYISEIGHPLQLIQELGKSCKGVVHVGANEGQEFESYRSAQLECVVYIEPVPEICERLRARIASDPRHVAVQALCSNLEGETVQFNVASNGGLSSSILPLARHASEHPEVTYTLQILLKTTTLDRVIFETAAIDPRKIDCLVLDVQGAEMKVIEGATRTL